MQCTAFLKSGNRCPRKAAPSSETCFRHRPAAEPPPPPSFYAQRFPAKNREALEAAAELNGLREEIAVLRTLIREKAAAGDLPEARREIEALARILRVQQSTGETSDRLAIWLEETLDELDSDHPEKLPGIPAH